MTRSMPASKLIVPLHTGEVVGSIPTAPTSNKKYASGFGAKKDLALPPARGFAILTAWMPA